jgi:peroxiredoxin
MAAADPGRATGRENASLRTGTGDKGRSIDAIAHLRHAHSESRPGIYASYGRSSLRTKRRPDSLDPVYSFYSLTERSEYTTTEADYVASLKAERNLSEGSPEFEQALNEFRVRMKKYLQDRLYPNMPDWPIFCFYPMTKRRSAGQNWYALPFETRKKLMAGHARIGRQYAGRVRQLITGATGLDDAEWGVTLFAHDVFQIKSIVYEMRFDTVSAEYADFGEFHIGIQLPLDQIFGRIQL